MKLYLKFISMNIRKDLQYKVSFITKLISQFLCSFSVLFSIYFMINRFHAINGFGFSEIIICFSIVQTSFALVQCFGRGFDEFPNLVRSGELDRLLIRPQNEIFQVLASNFDLKRIGSILQATIVLTYAIPNSNICWTPDKIITMIFMLIGGIGIYFALFIFTAGLSFFTIDSLEVMNIFTHGSNEFGRYPLSIYGQGILKFLTYIVPIALFQYYPLLYLIGRSTNVALIFLPLICVFYIIPCIAFFKFGLSKYKSTGS